MSLEDVVQERARYEAEEDRQRKLKMQMDSRNAICGVLQQHIEDEEWQALREALESDGYGFDLTWHGVDYRLGWQEGRFGADNVVTLWRKNGSFIERIYSGKDLLLWLAKH